MFVTYTIVKFRTVMISPCVLHAENILDEIQNKLFKYKENHPLGYEHQIIYGTDNDVRNLIKIGADINALGKRQTSYLWICMVHSKYERCLLLLELGANPDSDPFFRHDLKDTTNRYNFYDWAEKEVKLLYQIGEYINRYDMSIKIQKVFRMYSAKLFVHRKRLEPDFLFEPLYSKSRKRKYGIDDSRFKKS